jgi:small subunit ribosomal protein S8
MSIVDPVSDMLTRIRNAYGVNASEVCFESSKMKLSVLEIIRKSGYIEDYKNENGKVCVNLKYEDGKPAASTIERVSKPGRRVYVKKDKIPSVLSGHGVAIISTSKGLMTGSDAKKENLGGELICKVY